MTVQGTGPRVVQQYPKTDTTAPQPASKYTEAKSGALLKLGTSGESVKQLQEQLNAAGAQPALVADGKFGPKTEAALKAMTGSTQFDSDAQAALGRKLSSYQQPAAPRVTITGELPQVTAAQAAGPSKGTTPADRIIAAAQQEVGSVDPLKTGPDGKYKGWDHLQSMFAETTGWKPSTADIQKSSQPGGKAWCGIFAANMMQKAGYDVKWDLMHGKMTGKDVSQTLAPKWHSVESYKIERSAFENGIKPGDVITLNGNLNHHAIVTKVNGDGTVETIEGNKPGIGPGHQKLSNVTSFYRVNDGAQSTSANVPASTPATPSATTPTTTDAHPNSLNLGDKGPLVNELQSKLVGLGLLARADATGSFGAKTETAVKALQQKLIAAGLLPAGADDGVFGRKSDAALKQFNARPAGGAPPKPVDTSAPAPVPVPIGGNTREGGATQATGAKSIGTQFHLQPDDVGTLARTPAQMAQTINLTGDKASRMKALNSFTQLDSKVSKDQDENACGATCVVAGAAIQGGKEGLQNLVKVIEDRGNKMPAWDQLHKWHDGEIPEFGKLEGIKGRIDSGTVTMQDLADLKSIVYQQMHQVERDNKMKFDDNTINIDAIRMYVNTDVAWFGTERPLQGMFDQMNIKNVDLDGDGQAEHFVLMFDAGNGRAENAVFDPWPTKSGNQINQSANDLLWYHHGVKNALR